MVTEKIDIPSVQFPPKRVEPGAEAHAGRRIYVLPLLLRVFCLIWVFGRLARDQWWLSGLAFYIPTPVVTGCLLALLTWELKGRRLRGAAGTALFIAVCLSSLLASENRFGPSAARAAAKGSIRAVHWNVLSGKLGWPEAYEYLRELDADLYVLSESPRTLQESTFPGYESALLGSMTVFARGGVEPLGYVSTQPWLFLQALRCTVGNQELLLLAADFPSNILVHRGPLLEELNRQIKTYQPDLVLGDLNAPRDSLQLTQLPPGYAHAYEEVGTGWSYTWPMPLPVYSLDHCLFGPRVEPHGYQLGWTLHSDHRPQIFDFELR